MKAEQVRFKGHFHVEHYDKAGSLKATYRFPNGIKDVGLDKILEDMFNDGTGSEPWFLGLIDNSGFTSDPVGDTMASHAGWTEFQTYTEAVRQEWTTGTATSRSITNSATVDFSINATVTLQGIFVVDVSAHSPGNTGTLWSTALFPSTVAAVMGDTLKITYTVSG